MSNIAMKWITKLTRLAAVTSGTERTHAGRLVSVDNGTSSLVFTSHDVTRTCAAVVCTARHD